MNPYHILYNCSNKIKKHNQALFSKCQERNLYPELIVFEKNWKLIRDESFKLKSIKYTLIDEYQEQFGGNNWNVNYLILMNQQTIESRNSPNTMKILNGLINQGIEIRNAFFSFLMPNSKLVPHYGVQSSVLRYHLGLNCPKNCWLQIDEHIIPWKNGESFLWNDMYLHSAHNESCEIRTILILDIVRKDLNFNEKKEDNTSLNYVIKTEYFINTLNKINNVTNL